MRLGYYVYLHRAFDIIVLHKPFIFLVKHTNDKRNTTEISLDHEPQYDALLPKIYAETFCKLLWLFMLTTVFSGL